MKKTKRKTKKERERERDKERDKEKVIALLPYAKVKLVPTLLGQKRGK